MKHLFKKLKLLIASLRIQLLQFRYFSNAFHLVWDAAPRWTLLTGIFMLIGSLLPVANVLLTRSAIHALVEVFGKNGVPFDASKHLPPLAGLAGLMLFGEILGSVSAYVRVNLSEHVQDSIVGKIHVKSISLDMQFFESSEYYDQLQRASTEAVDRPLGMLQNMAGSIGNLITLAAMTGLLVSYGWWLPLVLLIGTLPSLWVAFHVTRRGQKWRRANTFDQRRMSYFNSRLIGAESAGEIRVFALGEHFRNTYRAIRSRLRGERMQMMRDDMRMQFLTSMWAFVTIGAALLWMLLRAMCGLIGLGDLGLMYQAINQVQGQMSAMVSNTNEIYRNLFFLDDLFTFLDLQPKLVDSPNPELLTDLRRGVRVEGVSYRYPGSERFVLKNFNLEIGAGKIVAIVGENGVGKSTLLKLLCRFYDPEVGRITWDGQDLRNVAQADLRRRITVLFQQPVVYPESVRNNIAYGDISAHLSHADIEYAAQSSSADTFIEKLPEGYETVLGRWFGKTDLSGGQWQRLGLARAFVRKADLVILDEPTSAMDSWAESDWMMRFRTLVAGRTALMITHRFTTALQADVIHVMHEGAVVESGTHAELVALGGRYAESWRRQIRDASAD